jgi:glucosamine-6-phosphate deaminase
MPMMIARFPTIDEWADHVADQFIALLNVKPGARFCLPTGNTPGPVYDRVAAAVRDGRASFREAEVFLLDEFGGVPADAAGRCDVMLRRGLLDHVDLPDDRYHRIDTHAPDVDASARAYDAALHPAIDLTILGIGANGHIGMNEPGARVDSPTRRVDLAPETMEGAERYFGGTHRPTWGITVGVKPLLASREVWLLATGASKAPVLRRLATEPVGAPLPASYLHVHPNCTLFADAAALPGRATLEAAT